MLKYRDSVKRIVRSKYGKKYFITIPRYIDTESGEIHRELPDNLLPYKHYEKNIIFGFVKGELSFDDLAFEDYPAEITVKRWSRNI